MRAINQQSRGIDKATDVLTFTEQTVEATRMNQLLFADAAAASLERRAEAVDCGSLFICLEYLHTRCVAAPHQNLPFLEYLKVALVHAVLHATGYQHESKEELRAMSKREQFVLARIDALERRFPHVFQKIDGFEFLKKQNNVMRRRR
ncbi:putative rRNA maturation factor [Strigomonas culicis]|nr:putative rRNA maturation factor [Strigomonas culicis]|eukprot:EPY31828.1 putative rRNA maturation factor [Strigomonas culicis]